MASLAGASYSAIIAAGGGSQRFGGNKLREKVGGKAVLSHSIDRFEADDYCAEVIICAGPAIREWIEGSPLVFSSLKLKVVDGGASRAESVRNGAQAAKSDVLAIHDGARPNFTPELLERLRRGVEPEVGVTPVLPVADTLAYVLPVGQASLPADTRPGTAAPLVERYLDRTGLHAVQTPQLFARESYLRALEQTGSELADYSDDSSLYLAAGFAVTTVAGLPGNIKLTTPDDLRLLLKLMGSGEKKQKDKYGGLGW